MDSTNQAHIDPRTLTQSQGEYGQIPSLSANTGAYSLSDPSSTGAAAYSFGETPQPVPSGKYGNALDDTNPHGHVTPQSHNPFLATGGNTDSLSSTAERNNLPSSGEVRDTVNDKTNQAANTLQSKADNARNTVNSNIPSSGEVRDKADQAANTVQAKTDDARNAINDKIPSSNEVQSKVDNAKAKVNDVANETATGIRQRVNTLNANVNDASATVQQKFNQASHHPVVENAKQGAQAQVGQFREYLGRSPTVVRLEKRLNIDRVFLVAGGALLYLLLIPLNLFGLALPTTTLLTLVPPVLLALRILDQDNMQDDRKTKSLLAYFVVLGFIQFSESLAAGVLAKRIPQYYTVKLIFLAYLLHPQTQGALKFHEAVLKPTFSQPASATRSSYGNVGNTGSSTRSSYGNAGNNSGYDVSGTNSNTTPPQSNNGGSAASSPFVGQMPVRGTVDAQGNITSITPAKGEFEVLTTGQ